MTGEPQASPKRRARVKFAVLVLIVVLAIVAVRFTPLAQYLARDQLVSLLDQLRSAPAAPLIFIAIYVFATALALPGSALTLTGGAVFGLWPGVLINWLGATIGATIAFYLARWLGRDFVAGRLSGTVATLDRNAARHGFRAIFLLRLMLIFPFAAINYAAGLSAIRAGEFVLATALGIIPGTFAYTYFADAILAGSIEARRDATLHIVLAALLLTALSLAPVIWRRFQKDPAP